ncbi:hypothetical protein [Aeromonas sp. 97A]|uniref:hypothetical protein n=1 Tax=Aeromonas sp. 97A TaxID=3452731 RepID=UPI003F78D17C
MGLIQFSGFDAVHSPDVTALNRLSGQAGSEGELYQPLDEVVDPLLTLPLPELAASDVAVEQKERTAGRKATQLNSCQRLPICLLSLSE